MASHITLTHCPAEPSAVRSYSACHGRFVVSLHTLTKRTSRNSWSVRDLDTGVHMWCWNRREAVEVIESMVTPPSPGTSRFVMLPRTTTPVEPEDLVLVDRLTGRWWKRYGHDDLNRDTQVLAALSVPCGYGMQCPV